MDSKLRWKAIWIGVLLVVGICFLAIIMNLDALKAKNAKEQVEMLEEEYRIGEDLSAEELRSFLDDAAFFDQEESMDLEASLGRQLSIQVLSVERDLRILIMDVAGELVDGEQFQITVDDVGTYSDDNKDGMIYIPSLLSGDYYVRLEEYDGYKVPSSTIKVNVKSNVEYEKIDDISYFIKTEDDVDATLEDTSIQNARSEADGTEQTIKMLPNGAMYFGIDVSKWNREIEWDKVKAAGVDFAIIRCGYRGSETGTLIEDPYFQKNIEGATNAGIDVGVYFFTQAINAVEAVEEASMVLALCDDYEITYPIFIDTEGAGGEGRADDLSVVARTNVCDAFCRTIENAEKEYTVGVYASKNWFQTKIEASKFLGKAIWLAEYKEEATYTGTYHMWQYTSKGRISGISGNVDLNISYMENE
jgi:GH25 family lysozyme M1 (1,4-beta-N-acetylmuramidase)